MIKHYIEWFYPGRFVSESSVSEIPERAAPTERRDGAYGYRMFSQSELTVDGERLIGAAKDFSPMTYFGEEFTVEQIKALPEPRPGAHSILISNIECNGYLRAVRTVRGNWQALDPNDVVIAVENPEVK